MTNKAKNGKQRKIYCPYCEEEMETTTSPYCKPCEIAFFYCPKCRKLISRSNKICPCCGADIRSAAAEEQVNGGKE